MKALVLSDIHGNLEALEAVLRAAGSFRWKELWFLGDLYGYGPNPEECFEILKQYNLCFIPGNHDLLFCGRLKASLFSEEAYRASLVTRALARQKSLNLVKLLPAEQIHRGIHLLHGSLENPSCDYILDAEDARRNFALAQKACTLFGHSHQQGFFLQEPSGEIVHARGRHGLSVSWKKKKALINPGSVGQPRDGNPEAAWGLLDNRKKEFTFFRSPYDYTITQKKMEKAGLSDFLCQRLARGI